VFRDFTFHVHFYSGVSVSCWFRILGVLECCLSVPIWTLYMVDDQSVSYLYMHIHNLESIFKVRSKMRVLLFFTEVSINLNMI
jgi:hypothetical protein